MGLRSCRGQAHGDGCGATTSVGDHEVLRVLAGCSQYHHELIMLVKLAGPRGCLAIKRRRSRATHRSRQRYQIPRRPNPQPSRRLIHIHRAHDAHCATEPASPGCSARRSNLVKSWIDSCLDDFAHHDFARKGFCSSPPCLLIVVAARQIGFAGSLFLSALLKNQEADRKIRDRKMQVMSLKLSRSPGFFVAHHEWRRGDLAKSWRAKS